MNGKLTDYKIARQPEGKDERETERDRERISNEEIKEITLNDCTMA